MTTSLQYQTTKFYDNGVIAMEKDNLKEVEGNYLVLDWSDIREALSKESLDILEQLIFSVRHIREVRNGKEPLEGIFVEKSYPFYEDTLQKVKMYFKQKNRKVVTMVSLGGQSMSVMEDINPKRPSKGVCIKITGHEEYISIDDFSALCNGSAVFNGFHYDIRVYPIKGDAVMMQIFDINGGFTHFYQTTKSSLKTVLESLI
ncbi:hypothetical protein ESCO45_00102 [Escherichia phage vB_EcoM_ESCO45]|uniref:Uncharacterized protein n=1 Tax=Escherichia phage vB_EcoM_ESCO45 TaxID=2918869 RepID=A0AAE9HJY4_9CAUD|nr:hypothetical protein ESCO45_00102 [Escherichia phage vB_EcoM_ESCO45]